MKKFTHDDIREVALVVRRRYKPEIAGNCLQISNEIGETLIERGLPYKSGQPYTVFEVRVGESGEECHYILKIQGKYIDDTNSNPLLVDASLDQFCDENKKEGIVDVSLGRRKNIESVYMYRKPVSQINRYMGIPEYFSQLDD